jgi:exodeoxyribonuclease III
MEVRISTWNVNGLHSAVRNGFEDWLKKSENDIVCLQEVKIQENLLTKIWFYPLNTYWNCAEKAGYSGVATLVKPERQVLNVEYGIDDHILDKEGRVIVTEFDKFILINTYAPHSHRELLRVDEKERFCEKFLNLLGELRKRNKPLIVIGDLNVAHKEIDLKNFKSNKNNAGFLEMERDWMSKMLEDGLCDAFRLFHPDTDHYTWWSVRKGVRERNIGRRLDYILVDESIRDKVKGCFHSSDQLGSDHCPVTVDIAL